MKRFLFILLCLCTICSLSAQTILGGGGICSVTGDPDNISDLQTQNTAKECMVAWDHTNQKLYTYNDFAALGNRWTELMVGVTDLDPDPDNEKETIALDLSNIANGTATVTLTNTTTGDQGSFDVQAGNGLGFSNNSGALSIILNETINGYKNHADAGTNGVAVGDKFFAIIQNTMGAVPGTILLRQ